MGQAMGQVFGHMSQNAPNGGLSGGQLFARKAVAGGLSGVGQSLQGKPAVGMNFNHGGPNGVMTPRPGGMTPPFSGGPTGVMSGNPADQPTFGTGGAGINGNSNPFATGPRKLPFQSNLYG